MTSYTFFGKANEKRYWENMYMKCVATTVDNILLFFERPHLAFWLNPTPSGVGLALSLLLGSLCAVWSKLPHCKYYIYGAGYRAHFSVFLSLILNQKLIHKGIVLFYCQLTLILVWFTKDYSGRCFSATVQQFPVRLGELKALHWVSDMFLLLSSLCRSFQKHLGD